MLLPFAILAGKKDRFFMSMLAYYETCLLLSPLPERFVPDSLSDDSFKLFFRFEREGFAKLLASLQFPATLNMEFRYKVSGEECLLILLRRLAYPARYCDLARLFGRSKSALSSIFNYALDHVFERTKHLVEFDWERLSPVYLEEMCTLNRRKGSLLVDCVGFIDGTVRPMCKPDRNQRPFYNGHKRVHSLKFQNIIFSDGIIVFMDGPYPGNRHDAGLLRESGLAGILERNLRGVDRRQLCIYGDTAYPDRPYLVCPFKGANLTDDQQMFNARMSNVRIVVEWSFGKIVNLFPFVDFKKNLKLGLQPIGKYFLVATVLTNCHTCCYGSQINDYFESDSPCIEEYLNLQ